ncbi:DNA-directed DNA polymerase gamma [Saccharomycopsis crataegensis]|uniref:Mitochondrial DNA polymerase catalytic subunit n=1 Tax=Saccharomycopsis crataegensis TaxID=43959 RepID=A0AAV5QQ12_9ASCO|nr:DNA-directed DNA polymerase gamma [Saccharomycopsis crataegensis]
MLRQSLRFKRAVRHASHLPNTANRSNTINFKTLPTATTTRPPLRKEKPTINEVGIQYLSRHLKHQIYPSDTNTKTSKPLSVYDKIKINLSQQYLDKFNLLNKKTNITDPITLDLPKLHGKTLNEHFIRLALNDVSPYLNFAGMLSSIDLPARPKNWLLKPGWYRYDPNSPEPVKVDYPLEDALVFDVETMYKVSPYPVLATCASPVAWYGWVSPYLTGDDPHDNHLIPMNTIDRVRLIIGHNVAYDRARIKEEYSFKKTEAFYLDTLSLHAAVTGICSRQRPVWSKYKENSRIEKGMTKEIGKLLDEKNFIDHLVNDQLSMLGNEKLLEKYDSDYELSDNPWASLTSTNSLADVAKLHCGITMSKVDRDYFKTEDKQEIIDNFQKLMNYCATDVATTQEVFKAVYPLFTKLCPHPVSFSSLRHINTVFLPTTYKTWENYIHSAESLYQNNKVQIEQDLAVLALKLVEKFKQSPEEVLNDPWYSQLNWEIKPIKMTKSGVPFKRQKLPGFPEWYKSLFPSATGPIKLTIRTRLVPILLKLKWEGLPLMWTETKGWCFRVESNKFTLINELTRKNYTRIDDFTEDPNFEALTKDYQYVYFKIPHPNGPSNRTTSLTSKSFLKHYEKQVLTSEYEIAQKVLELNASASYWISSRERIMSQFVVYDEGSTRESSPDFNLPMLSKGEGDDPIGIIIPQILPMGTITRRAVEKTWLTASNVKKNRIGSELKTKIQAPAGYSFVGADVDSEELWIASLLSDSVFKIHGGSAIGWMTLEGNKLEKTDLHSKTAEILGISRNEAKIFNYSRIYGAGLKHTSTLLKQFNPSLNEKQVITICNNLFDSTKGKTYRLSPKEKKTLTKYGINLSKIWYGGSESVLFNRLENLAETKTPKTPVLKAGITEALKKENLNANSFLPSRINWAIQSSGVDYLHLLITSMEYLIKRYAVEARLCITVHDEIRYMVKDEDKYKAALLLQIANVWTRGIFCEQLGISDIPQSCAFFSQVDIDKILRKEVDTPCETPSNQGVVVPDGETLDINGLLAKLGQDPNTKKVDWLDEGSTINLNKFKVDKVLEKLKDTSVSVSGNSSGNLLSNEQEKMFINLQIEQDTSKVKTYMRKLTAPQIQRR